MYMKTTNQTGLPQNNRPAVPGRQVGFTLIELLLVIAVIAILAAVLLPASSHSTPPWRTKCANNLRQLVVGSTVYGDDFGKLPPWQSGMGDKENDMRSDQNSLWVYSSAPKHRPPMSFKVPPGASFHNMGYLYGMKAAGDGGIFYCPALKTGPYCADTYSPLLTCDAGGAVRSSYNYNPRMINWNPGAGPVDTHRAILRSADLGLHRKVFGMDVISGTFAHSREGWNVIFTDSSVRFCKGTGPLLGDLPKRAQNNLDYAAREQLFDIFEGM
jgi:prepilin-type N-terminal cleavage/methylation domain-containing protein